jgi:hypothetical protein
MYFIIKDGKKIRIDRSEARKALDSIDMTKRPDCYSQHGADAYLDEVESEKYGDFNVHVAPGIHWTADEFFDEESEVK